MSMASFVSGLEDEKKEKTDDVMKNLQGSVLIAMPSRGHMPVDILTAYMSLKKPKNFFSSNNIMPLDEARNALCREFLIKTPEATHILFWDDDVIPRADALTKLWSHNEPIVSGLYFKKLPPFEPLIDILVTRPDGEQGYTPFILWEPNKSYYVDGVGMGFCLIRKDVIQSMDPPWFKFDKFSEDYNFCRKAKSLGYKIKVDTSVVLTHMADRMPVNLDLYRRYQEDVIRGTTQIS